MAVLEDERLPAQQQGLGFPTRGLPRSRTARLTRPVPRVEGCGRGRSKNSSSGAKRLLRSQTESKEMEAAGRDKRSIQKFSAGGWAD